MSDVRRIAVVGDRDLVLPFRALGMRVFSPRDTAEARSIMKTIRKEDYAVCLVEQRLLEPLKEEREIIGREFCPVVVGFSDYRDVADYLEEAMRDMAVKATGSDSLVKRRGKDETR